MKNAGWQEIARQGIDPESCEMQAIYHALLSAAQAPTVEPASDEAFCDGHCTWLDHQPGCSLYEPAHSDVSVPAGVAVERDFMGTMHIKVGDFDFIQIQYQHPYTDNSGTWKLAERIAALLAGGEVMSEELKAKITEQAREIEINHCLYASALIREEKLRTELATLKAQPSAVVMPERRPEVNGAWGDNDDAYDSGVNDTLDDVTRLNASRVPEGWRPAPSVATLEMKNAGWQEIARQGIDPESCEMQAIYHALLSAAPAPTVQLTELRKRQVNYEQAAFEDWLARCLPFGDVAEVTAQWLESSDYQDLQAALTTANGEVT
jgi:hypothetical protein